MKSAKRHCGFHFAALVGGPLPKLLLSKLFCNWAQKEGRAGALLAGKAFIRFGTSPALRFLQAKLGSKFRGRTHWQSFDWGVTGNFTLELSSKSVILPVKKLQPARSLVAEVHQTGKRQNATPVCEMPRGFDIRTGFETKPPNW